MILHLDEMLGAVAAFPHGFLEAPVHIALVAFGLEVEVSEFDIHARVREGHVVV